MAGETVITVVGNLTRDPELRTTASGASVVNFTIASTSRTYNRQTQQWEESEPLFLNCSAWDSSYNPMAHNIQASLAKGMRVIAQGRLSQRSYTANDGTNRTVIELRVDEIGPALSRNTAQVVRNTNNNHGGAQGGFNQPAQGGYQGGYQGGSSAQPAAAAQGAPAVDPWSTSPSSGSSFGSFGASDDFGGSSDEPEF